MLRLRFVVAGIAGLSAAIVAGAIDAAAQSGATAVTCTNPVGGASWQIKIDYGNATVDARPAAISPAKIAWFDPTDGGNYTLDRKSGDLTASVASSTGGYFRYARCKLETSP